MELTFLKSSRLKQKDLNLPVLYQANTAQNNLATTKEY